MSAAARALRRLVRSEDGFTLIEVVVALTLLSFASAAFAVTTGHGFRLVGTSQERQTAIQVANEWMEQARVIPYDGLALPSSLTWGGAGTPDEDVSGTTYTGEAGTEELVLESGSTLEHVIIESVNNIDYEAYRYVPEQDGLLVRSVEDASPAAEAGIEEGDLLVGAAGRALTTVDDLYDVLDSAAPGTSVTIDVVRGTESRQVTVAFPAD